MDLNFKKIIQRLQFLWNPDVKLFYYKYCIVQSFEEDIA